MKEQEVVVVTLTWATVWASHFKVLRQSFLCDGQGDDRRAILYMDRFFPL